MAELEGRVARIKRALEIRDAMRDTIIDQRTDELLDEMEEAGSSGTRGGPAAPDGVRPGNNPGAEKGAATPPAESDAAVKEQAHILKRQLDEAKANLESAEHAKERALRLFRSGAISQDAVVEEAQKVKPARILFDRLVLQWDAFLEAHPDLPKTKAPAARDGAPNGPTKPSTERGANPRTESDADASRHKSRLLELDADEAIANFESAERDFRRLEKLRASGAIEQAVLDEQVEKLALARIKLERAAQKWALDVEEAQANLGSAERAYKRAEKLHASGAIEQSVLDEQADKYNRAQIELNRAESKIHTTFDRVEQRLKALDQPLGLPVEQPAKQAPTGAGALDEPTKTSSEQAPVDDSINSLP
ncbi:MAG TPA: hypothetical protein VNH11_35635 [Pirellulales bacterium]|nr:hypothetical protein [Pirellulales bacterium]